jgi:hypothetical protein
MPPILNNITNWRVFNDDQHIISFLHHEDNFKYFCIDEGQHDQDMNPNSPDPIGQRVGSKFTLINNIPQNEVRPKNIYDLWDKFVGYVLYLCTSSSVMYLGGFFGTWFLRWFSISS